MISELFEMVDNIIITAGILCGIIVVVSIVYAVVSCLIQEKKERQKRKQEEELRQKRLSKIAIKDRKCSTCRYGEKEEEFSTDIVYWCSHPKVKSSVAESEHIGCSVYDTNLWLTLADLVEREKFTGE